MEQRNITEFLKGLQEYFTGFYVCFILNHLRYLCKLSDQELRQSAARNMADLMWSTVKEPLDTTLCFDKESLDLAFKYFMSPTLTMRLAGLSQITVSYICSFWVIFYLPSALHHHHHYPYYLWGTYMRRCACYFTQITLYGLYK